MTKKFTLFFIATFAFLTFQQAQARPEPSPYFTLGLSLASDGYVPGLGRFAVRSEQGHKVRVFWDRNICQIDGWGSYGGCTKMAALAVSAVLETVERDTQNRRFKLRFQSQYAPLNKLTLILQVNQGPLDSVKLLYPVDKSGVQVMHVTRLMPRL